MAQPYWKEEQLRHGAKRYHRKVASPKSWQAIIDAKSGPCRVCGGPASDVEYHHLVPRSLGGHDKAENIVPLCPGCHRAVTGMDRAACAKLRESLTDAEYAYAVEELGEDRFEKRFPVDWKAA